MIRRLRGALARHRSLLVMYLVSGALGVPLFLTGATLSTSAGDYRTSGAVVRNGTARVERCDRYGPVSLDGFGYHWACDVTVRWDDGRTERVTVRHGQLGPADVGRQVPLAERRSRGRGYSIDDVVPPFTTDTGRADTGFAVTAVGIVVGVPFAALTVGAALFVVAVVAIVVLATLLWLVRLAVSPRAALDSARKVFRRPPA